MLESILAPIYENGYGGFIYNSFLIIGFLVAFAFNLWYCEKYGISKKQACITIISAFSILVIWVYVLSWAETGFKSFGNKDLARGVVYVPLAVYPASRILCIKWKKACDLIAPCVCIFQGISHWGCIFTACCRGFECDWGIYNPALGFNAFPSQPFEAITALVIAIIVVIFAYRRKFETNGLAYPIMLMLFGSTRFLWEFARDNEKIFLGCSSLALHALFMMIVGIIAFVELKEKENKRLKRVHPHKRRKQK
ncbi:MAG: prolipoprotein diacylglyceryl transferase [Clostridia bacterium]|nr:prolipoprotein diacylglyceryl transferase [Clostridia bacterium]